MLFHLERKEEYRMGVECNQTNPFLTFHSINMQYACMLGDC